MVIVPGWSMWLIGHTLFSSFPTAFIETATWFFFFLCTYWDRWSQIFYGTYSFVVSCFVLHSTESYVCSLVQSSLPCRQMFSIFRSNFFLTTCQNVSLSSPQHVKMFVWIVGLTWEWQELVICLQNKTSWETALDCFGQNYPLHQWFTTFWLCP